MRRARAGQLFGLLLVPTPVFGVNATPWMGEWVGGRDGAIWDGFSSWTCPFLVWDMGQPLSLTYCPRVIKFPILRLHWVMVNLGTESGKVIVKVARRARAGRTLPHSMQPGVLIVVPHWTLRYCNASEPFAHGLPVMEENEMAQLMECH